MPRFRYQQGQVVGRLTLFRFLGLNRSRNSLWECHCLCGIPRVRSSHYLTAWGDRASCGCLQKRESHRKAHTAEYKIWLNMRARCYDASRHDYAFYGAKGVGVYPAWRWSFSAFLRDVGRRPSHRHQLLRRDTTRDFSPHNTYWGFPFRRARHPVMKQYVVLAGEARTLSAWASALGISRGCLEYRLKVGKGPLDILQPRANARSLEGETQPI